MLPELYNTTRRDIPEEKLRDVTSGVLRGEGLEVEEVTAVYCGRDLSRRINREFLQHDYATDTITFRYNEGRLVEGEFYICLDVVEDNARRFGVDFLRELLRVTIHSALHLAGYRDASPGERADMRALEDVYLERLG
ncbi:rRNA maturation RNase YbeY [Prosthecochloris sp. N3]|uniref:Endoribonuclease YbeY n=1 Tax=Prosthecochloris ethylica TaxID=2743976 RepID=A0ABR9XQG6_9CHLB|nr:MULTISPECIES: rRNA maturation RNase YbeY [Prosthecochloris]MEC9486767.1 rRNA maturation RNase YbeY [Prosthecochloris sp.]MBF0585511.1 rRNA maturation RNase YbeY [Prosthecochloris ethylica]MBF0636297.1 rRNA maturation RNase YbeY [Prosthecochloris ethylica]NUK46741.1 rRNA maturation RNase YbeY [Prosthecochloris ethylica]RNA64676.1 rRNA maturation RNase YbeY [Prosthecochloris sp. ZM_2]